MAETENVSINTSEKRIRKSIQRLSEVYDKDFEALKERKPVSIEGSGIKLGDIERVKEVFHRGKLDKEIAKHIHHICYKTLGRANRRNGDIKKFNGFDQSDDNEIKKRISIAEKINVDSLKVMCDLFNIPSTGKHRKDIANALVEFFKCPIETGSVNFRTVALRPKHKSKKSKNTDKATKEKKKNVSKDVDLKDADNQSITESLSDIDSEHISSPKKMSGKENIMTEDVKEKISAPKRKRVQKKKIEGETKKSGKKNIQEKGLTLEEKINEKEEKVNEKEERLDESDDKNDMGNLETETDTDQHRHNYDLSDDNIKSKIAEILKGADLNNTTLNQVCDNVTAQFPEADLIAQRHHIKQLVKKVIDES